MGAAIGTGSAGGRTGGVGSRVIPSRIQFAGSDWIGDLDQERETQRAARGARASRPPQQGRPGQQGHHSSRSRGSMVAGAAHLHADLRPATCDAATLRRCDPGPGQRVTLHGCVPSHGHPRHPKPSQDKTGSRGTTLQIMGTPKFEPYKACVHRYPSMGPTPNSAGSGSGKRCSSRSCSCSCSRSRIRRRRRKSQVTRDEQATDPGQGCLVLAARRGFPAPSFA